MSTCRKPLPNKKYDVAVVENEPGIEDIPVVVLAKDQVPTVDQEVPLASYQDWKRSDTEVVTYTIGNNIYKGIYAHSREEAKAHCELTRGRILEANYVPGRAFFRVQRKVKTQ